MTPAPARRTTPDLTTPAAEIRDPMLLLARVGYRAYLTFRGATRPTYTSDRDMIDDLDRLTKLLDADTHRCCQRPI